MAAPDQVQAAAGDPSGPGVASAACASGTLRACDWSEDQVVCWLEQIGLHALKDVMSEHCVAGDLLVMFTDLQTVQKWLPNVPGGLAFRLIKAVEKLQADEAEEEWANLEEKYWIKKGATSMNLSGNIDLTDAHLKALAEQCPNVTEVWLCSTKVSDIGIKALAEHCRDLEQVDMRTSNVSDVAIKAMAEHCPKLTHAILFETNVGDIGIKALAEHCRGLTHINLTGTNVSDVGAKALAEHCRDLKHIFVGGTKVSDIGRKDLEDKISGVAVWD
eukprot:TRINITY_DN11326_c1_g2_i1.p1 TRINITY_DN11326_c1_g2~~TRINITY_DN11326_c1_g2_i1.p1  ORF type:complete len:300 (-),score=32.74 TRINITY_DN11326_c1_g2_i1:53-874(-)